MVFVIEKMSNQLINNKAQYHFDVVDHVTKQNLNIDMNALVGKKIKLQFLGKYFCSATGEEVKKL